MIKNRSRSIRIMYSFPNKLGAGRICSIAWQHIMGLTNAGADVTVLSSSVRKKPPESVRLLKTLGLGPFRVPFRLIGTLRALALHDWIASHWLKRHADEIDVVHCWPLAALQTIGVAKKYGIPVLLERQNTHSEFAYRVVEEECARIGLVLPKSSEHKFDAKVYGIEIREYNESDYLLCPSDFVRKTFLDRGFPSEKLLRHQYGYDDCTIQPGNQRPDAGKGLVMIYAGICTPRKGLHHALKAWLASSASKNGIFLICGEFLTSYREKLAELLDHPSVKVLGQRSDVTDLMRKSDIFVLSTVEEGSALVTYEARGAGCVILVSDASGAVCKHAENALVHPAGDVEKLTEHINQMDNDRVLLGKLRASSLETLDQITWRSAGTCLLKVYEQVITEYNRKTAAKLE